MAYLALQGAYMQDPLITIRVVIFASWGKERTSPESTASVAHPRARSSCGLWLPFPPSSKVWTIDSSWSLQNSSLVYLGGEFSLCLLWLDLPPDGSTISCVYSRIFCRPHLLQRPSGIVSWATYRPFVFSSLTGCSEGGCSSLASRINGISWTTSFRSPGSLSIESFSSLVDLSGPAA